jgi:hypothetical protein
MILLSMLSEFSRQLYHSSSGGSLAENQLCSHVSTTLFSCVICKFSLSVNIKIASILPFVNDSVNANRFGGEFVFRLLFDFLHYTKKLYDRVDWADANVIGVYIKLRAIFRGVAGPTLFSCFYLLVVNQNIAKKKDRPACVSCKF